LGSLNKLSRKKIFNDYLWLFLSFENKKKGLNDNLNRDELFIVKKMIDGDKDAFKHFFQTYYNDLCNFTNTYVRDTVLAEEIVQDIFVYFWENKSKLQLTHSAKSYLYSASRYKSLNVLRDKNRKERIHSEITDFQSSLVYPEEELLDSAQLRTILDSAINELPPKCREIFLLSKRQELSNKEIADQLDITVKGVENQMTIALKKMRDSLAPYREKIFVLFIIQLFY
jgi:RNA polymerase sigma-70 factor, ECF subfamily